MSGAVLVSPILHRLFLLEYAIAPSPVFRRSCDEGGGLLKMHGSPQLDRPMRKIGDDYLKGLG